MIDSDDCDDHPIIPLTRLQSVFSKTELPSEPLSSLLPRMILFIIEFIVVFSSFEFSVALVSLVNLPGLS